MPRKERVTRVNDGDTFRTASRKNPVRLAKVDAPERGQRGYQGAKTALAKLIAGETVTVDTKARDAYGRSIANVRLGGKSVNRMMQRRGR